MSGPGSQSSMAMKVFKMVLWTHGMTACMTPYSAVGPALPDMQQVLHTDLTSVSSVFICFTICGLLAFLVTPMADKVAGSNLLIAVCHGAMAISLAAAPFSSNVYVFLALMFGFGVPCYSSFAVFQTCCAGLWEKPGAAMRLLYFGAALGWVLGPLLMSPFVSPSYCFHSLDRNSTANLSITDVHGGGECGGSIHLAFLTLASQCGLVCLGAVVLLVLEGRGLESVDKTETFQKDPDKIALRGAEETNIAEECDELLKKADEKKQRVWFFITVVLYYTASCCSFAIPGQWLPVYGLHSPLHFELRTLSFLAGGFFGCIAAGSLVSSIASIYVGQKVVMGGGLVGMVAASIVVLLLGDKTPWGLGAVVLVFSFMSGPLYNSAIILVSEEMGLTTTMSSVFLIAYALAVEGLTFVYGIVLKTFGYWVFLWTPLVCTLVTLVFFAPTVWMMRK